LAYTFKPDKSVPKNVRHIAESQVEKAIAEIDDSGLGMHDTVHQIRKRCKKLRGLIRLVRPGFGAYAAENAAFRDAAAELSYIRDAEAILETYDTLIDFYSGEIDTGAYTAIRERFAERKAEIARETGLEDKLARFRNAMTDAKARIAHWDIDADGFAGVTGGLGKTYKRGRKAMAAAADQPTAESVHEWRKRMKYHWYHARLLKEIWPKIMTAHAVAAKELGDRLSTHHDLAVLQNTVTDAFDGAAETVQTFIALAEGRQALLEAEARDLGAKLLAETPKALKRRWGAYWDAWQTQDTAAHLVRAA
jgi:CHAD domain-containing protein